ncbi:MAG TPA: hypothetical protein VG326_13735 [Tepidisphaeraceae bacterium]|nr:hypothetical protein [Tepidisphaeraceae bacterium]
MTDNQLEFSISQYLDGTLGDDQRSSLERRLNEDADAMAMLETYRRLDVLIKSDAGLPDIAWDSFARTISAAVDAADAAHEESVAQRFRMPGWVKTVMLPTALAASVLVATGVGWHAVQMRWESGKGPVAAGKPAPPASASFASVSVFGSESEPTHGPREVQVAIGPSADAKDQPILVHYSGDVVSRASRVAVASGVAPVHDTDALSFDMQ